MAKTNVSDLSVVLSASSDQLAGDLRAAAKLLDGFKKQVDGKGGDVGSSKAGLRDAAEHKKRAKELADAHDKVGIAGKAAMLATAAGGFIAQAAMAGLRSTGMGVVDVFDTIKESVKMAADVEQVTLAFDVMLGSAKEAAQMVGDLRKFGSTTPFKNEEVVAAGRALLAYGLAADQIVPTLRMLSDVSSAFGKDLPLSQLTADYGKVFASQRAYSRELMPMAQAGVPIYEELGKVLGKTGDEIHKLGEEGKLSSDHVTRAFIAMTSEGGRFFNMTARQGKTLGGLWTTTTDAFDMLKVKFGQMIIEEAGLKDVVQDLEKFGHDLQLGIDTSGIREAIRFTADLVKGVVQVGYEFVKAGVQGADIFGQMAKQVPEFKGALEGVQHIVDGMKGFRLDPADIASAAIDISKDILANAGLLIVTAAELGKTFKDDVLDPLIDAIKFMRELVKDVKGAKPAVERTSQGVHIFDLATSLGGHAGIEDIRGLGEIFSKVGTNGPQGIDVAREIRELIVPGSTPRAEDMKAAGGPAPGATPAEKDAFDRMRDFGESLQELTKNIDRAGDNIKNGMAAQREAKRMAAAEVALAKHDAEMAQLMMTYRAFIRGQVAGFAGLTPNDPLAGVAMKAAEESRTGRINAGVQFGLQMATGSDVPGRVLTGDYKAGNGVNLSGNLEPGAADLFKKLKEKNNPLAPEGDLMRHRGELDELLKRKLIPQAWADKDWHEAVKGTADHMGLGGQTQLPEAMARGSAESVATINKFQSGSNDDTVEGLLRLIVEATQGMLLQGQTGFGLRGVIGQTVSLPK